MWPHQTRGVYSHAAIRAIAISNLEGFYSCASYLEEKQPEEEFSRVKQKEEDSERDETKALLFGRSCVYRSNRVLPPLLGMNAVKSLA